MEQTGISTPAETRVAIVADDLIWASRLRAAVQNAGAEPVGAKAGSDIGERFVVIDLGGRTYDGIAAVREAASAGVAGRATLVVPRLERAAAEAAPAVGAALVDVVTWEETEDPFELVAARLDASDSRPEIQIGALGGAWGRLGGLLVSDRLWATFLL